MSNKHTNKVSLGNKIFFEILAGAVKLAARIVLGFKIDTDEKVRQWKKSKDGFIVLCAHPSEFDAVVLLSACFPRYTRFVAGAQQLYKGFQGKMLRLIKVIPKKQFVPDISAIKEMMKTIKSGYVLGMMPEGRVSMDGTPNPNDISTAKLLKKIGAPVAILIPHGTYFIKPSYNYSGIKIGKISAEMKCLFTAEDLSVMSEDEILSRLSDACSYNAAEELRGMKRHYGSKKNNAFLGVSRILYRCPACGSMYSISDDGYTLSCRSCKKKAKLSEDMFIESLEKDAAPSWPDNIPQWNADQISFEHDFWKNYDASISFAVKKSMLTLRKETDYHYCCDGLLSLDANGLHYSDKEETIDAALNLVAGVSADYQHGFITYYQGNDIRRFTLENSQYVTRFVNSLMVLKNLK